MQVLDDVHRIDATKMWMSINTMSEQMNKTGNDILTYIEPMAGHTARVSSGKREKAGPGRPHADSVGQLRNKLESENSMHRIRNVSINLENAKKRFNKRDTYTAGENRPRLSRALSAGRE